MGAVVETSPAVQRVMVRDWRTGTLDDHALPAGSVESALVAFTDWCRATLCCCGGPTPGR